jgi:ribose 5-phosphate isomerase B
MDKSQPKIIIACDHAGFDLKEYLKSQLIASGYDVDDCGCKSADVSVDYPDYANIACKKINPQLSQIFLEELAILICGSGIGISISANRNKNIRAALCNNIKLAKLARAHNNANVLCLGSRFVKEKKALAIIKIFLKTKFEGGRHEARVNKLS